MIALCNLEEDRKTYVITVIHVAFTVPFYLEGKSKIQSLPTFSTTSGLFQDIILLVSLFAIAF